MKLEIDLECLSLTSRYELDKVLARFFKRATTKAKGSVEYWDYYAKTSNPKTHPYTEAISCFRRNQAALEVETLNSLCGRLAGSVLRVDDIFQRGYQEYKESTSGLQKAQHAMRRAERLSKQSV